MHRARSSRITKKWDAPGAMDNLASVMSFTVWAISIRTGQLEWIESVSTKGIFQHIRGTFVRKWIQRGSCENKGLSGEMILDRSHIFCEDVIIR